MADGEHTHANKHLTLDEVQTIIGRAIVDESFRDELTNNPEKTLKKLGISTLVGGDVDQKSVELIRAIADAFKETNTDTSLKEVLEKLRSSYLDSTDGIIRSRCL
ncbi:Os1348 family NHLP clan protein [Yoonia sp. BS5-3]|uniref:Os1348 family NHLP clan protein n=1 Tax=Yoonia phaeophyticola TaxID=3137369 RepID=A0ABZ2V9L2_9RHOB